MDARPDSVPSSEDDLSPFHVFNEEDWARLRAGQPMTLSADEIVALRGFNDYVSPEQVETIYLPLSRLLSLYVEAGQALHRATFNFLGKGDVRVPYIVGIAGSVAVGKTTTARLLQALLGRWANRPKVALVTTDGFLLPNAQLEADGIMNRKGFPESYDVAALISFLSDIKAGERRVKAPVYSHLTYDRVPDEFIEVDHPDILILEGLNVLQTTRQKSDRPRVPFVSDFFDFSIYIDAEEDALERWYLTRFLRLKETRFTNPKSYFHRFAEMAHSDADVMGRELWRTINLKNLRENVAPTKLRADLILHKSPDHRIDQVALRKI